MKKQTLRTFLRFIAPYVLVLLTILVLGHAIYMKSVQVLAEETMQLQLSNLENSMHMVDGMIRGAENISIEFSLEQKYRSALLKFKDRIQSYYAYIEVWKTLNSAGFNMDYVLDYAVYFPEADFLLTSQTASTTPELCYGDQLVYDGMDFAQWKAFLAEADRVGKLYPAAEVRRGNQTVRALSYVRQVPFDLRHPEAVLQVFLPEQEILRAFDGYVNENHGLIGVLDRDGTLLTAEGSLEYRDALPDGLSFDESRDYFYLEPRQGERWGDYLVYVKSEDTGLIYLSVLPEQTTLQKVNSVKRETLTIAAAITAIIALLGCWTALHNLRSVRQISRKLRGFGAHRAGLGDAYADINENLDSLLESHDRLSATFQQQASRILSSITMDLLLGRCSNVEEVLDTVEETGIRVRTEHYCTAIFKIVNQEELPRQKQAVESSILCQSSSDLLAADFARDRVAVLFCGDGPAEEFADLADRRLRRSAEEIRGQGIDCFCVLGPTVDSVEDIRRSTAAASGTILSILYDGEVLVYSCDSMEHSGDNVFYSVETEQKIINMVRQGSREEVLSFLEDLIADRCATEGNVARRKAFYLQLGGTLGKIQRKTPEYSDFYKQLEQSNDEAAIVRALRDGYGTLAQEYLTRKKNGSCDIILVIQNYIRENYMDPSLCLAGIARKFNISEVYFSQTFKTVTGENFSVYLEKLRMEEARKLLRDSEKTVEEVAQMVGYNSINTFHKAFKRVNGITPGAFKKLR